MKLFLLGTTQDSGYPQIGCQKACCQKAWDNPFLRNYAVSMALVNESKSEYYLFDVTPDIKYQLEFLYDAFPTLRGKQAAGIFLTHAHIGHYTGLIHFSIEAMDSENIPTYVMPRMKDFLEVNGPWSQLIEKENIKLIPINEDELVSLDNIQVSAFLVPHRDEFSETVGYKIRGPNKSVLFIPDIDKWEEWGRDIREEVSQVDVAYLDGSFYQEGELIDRDMSMIKHPYVMETMELFSDQDASEKSKIRFIHLNHTNPLLDPNSDSYKNVKASGYKIAQLGEVIAV